MFEPESGGYGFKPTYSWLNTVEWYAARGSLLRGSRFVGQSGQRTPCRGDLSVGFDKVINAFER
ncbi:hypothetical protein [Cryobacterium melibiosiphilum]|uniref:hypothetical protein n=1 Tax=Cryobacterium melibiosiphilum TaxID=995039 RepID=UPI0011C228F2|nr:hypothetical protein [Cryobacterium melibiosiphilum]